MLLLAALHITSYTALLSLWLVPNSTLIRLFTPVHPVFALRQIQPKKKARTVGSVGTSLCVCPGLQFPKVPFSGFCSSQTFVQKSLVESEQI